MSRAKIGYGILIALAVVMVVAPLVYRHLHELPGAMVTVVNRSTEKLPKTVLDAGSRRYELGDIDPMETVTAEVRPNVKTMLFLAWKIDGKIVESKVEEVAPEADRTLRIDVLNARTGELHLEQGP